MPDAFAADSPDFSKLSADVREVHHGSMKPLMQALEVTGRNVRDTARDNAMGMAHAPAFPFSITYDMVGDSHGGGALGAFIGGRGGYNLQMDIGPDKDRPQGALGNLIEYGSVNNPPQGIMHGALQANEADFERGVERAVDDALKAAGL